MDHSTDLADDEPPRLKPGHVLITRRTWDRLIGLGIVAAGCLGAAACRLTGEPRMLGLPAPLLLLWALVRFQWPREGASVPTIGARPGEWWLYGFLGIWGCVAVVVLVGIQAIAPTAWRGPPETPRFVALLIVTAAVMVVGLLIGVSTIERRFGLRQPKKPRRDETGLDE